MIDAIVAVGVVVVDGGAVVRGHILPRDELVWLDLHLCRLSILVFRLIVDLDLMKLFSFDRDLLYLVFLDRQLTTCT